MAERTGIEWCDHTFNIAWGCQKVSPGCAHCYAEHLADDRFAFGVFGPAATTSRRTFGAKHWNEPRRWNRAAERDGVRRRVFCSSMGDVFEDHPAIDLERAKLWPLIRETPHLDWLLLTKRPERIAAQLPADWGEGYPNVWLGTSVESQEYVERARILAEVPARVRFVSCEPLLGPVDLGGLLHGPIDWVIAGGESGPGARPCDQEWLRDLRDECDYWGAEFFLKQLGGHPNKRSGAQAVLDGVRRVDFPSQLPEPLMPANKPHPEHRPWVVDGLQRRVRVDLWHPAEHAIQAAVDAVEAAGAHPRLTEAVILLGQARHAVADAVEILGSAPVIPAEPPLPPRTPEPRDAR